MLNEERLGWVLCLDKAQLRVLRSGKKLGLFAVTTFRQGEDFVGILVAAADKQEDLMRLVETPDEDSDSVKRARENLEFWTIKSLAPLIATLGCVPTKLDGVKIGNEDARLN